MDAKAYDSIAWNLVSGDGFREDRSQGFTRDLAITRAGPGYEFWLAAVYALFGHRYQPVWVVQSLLHAFSALLLYLIARRVWGERGKLVGIITAALFGLHPDLIEISAMLLTETLFLFLAVLVVYLFVEWWRSQARLSSALVLGVVSALAILTRPTVVLFVPVFLAAFIATRRYRALIPFFLGLIIPLVPWTVRNYLVFHEFIPTTLIGAFNLWIGNTLAADGGQLSGGLNPVRVYGEQYGYGGLSAEASREFWSFLTAHPLVFLKLTALRLIRYGSLIRPMGFWFYQYGLSQLIFVAFSTLSIAILFLSGGAGLALFWRQSPQPLLKYLLALALTAPLPLLFTVVQSRYRFPLYPWLALGAGLLVVWARETPGWWRRAPAVGVAVSLLALTAADVLLNFGTVSERLGRWW
ncbi:MAG: glycosyltransferase family 39 protein [Candidatus Magasanikbacteria bacterium]|nr:glycosyltransferase family 39 protein [Candidatus Magasanikbacteria bacterium]